MRNLIRRLAHYKTKEEGLVTIEWVGIAAVVVLAAIVITSGIMNSASGLGTAVIGNIDTAAEEITPDP